MLRRHLKKALHRLTASGYQTLNQVELNRAHVIHNIAHIRHQHPGIQIIPVLKANAYGHGIGPMARILQAASCPLVAVDGYFEAEKIHAATRQRVLVMGAILPQNVRLLDTKHTSYVVQDIAGLQAFATLRRPVSIHLELNTGMNRLGLNPSELDPYLDILKAHPQLQLEGVMTHLADADNPTSQEFSRHQRRLFDQQVEHILAAGFRPAFIHIAQTAGSTKTRSQYANAIRLGIGTYGINPLSPADPGYSELQDLKPALALKSTIIKTLELRPGDKVSYNGIFTAPRPMRIGVLPLGYYEGIPRALSNVGSLTHASQSLPILGRVCMNHTIIDLQDTGLQVGDQVTVISQNPADPNSVASLQANHDLFAYATLTGISSTIKRKIV